MSEEVKEGTSKIAKLVGVLVGLSTWILYFLIESLIFFILDEIFQFKEGKHFDLLMLILLLGFFPSYFVGCLINYKWQGFTKRMKTFVITVSVLLIIPFVPETYSDLKKLIPESGSADGNFKKDERISISTTYDKGFKGTFQKWNDDFIILKVGGTEIQIPKDKIHWIKRGW